MVLLDDERISNIAVGENQEELASLKGIHKDILVDESRSQIMNQSDFFCHARRSVAEMLKEAAGYLPPGYQILIKEAYRPLSQQKKSFETAYQDYKKMYPARSDEEIYKMTCQFVAPVKVAGHPTGGAIDLTLLKDGEEQDMGTVYNAVPLEPENRTYLYSDYISEEARRNRKILIDIMEKAGFANYPTEWWHWSYGDCYWAFLNQCDAIFTPIEAILKTDRLYLREIRREDYEALCRMLKDEEVMYAYEHAFDDKEAQEWLELQLNRYENDGFGLWAVVLEETGEVIGQCGLTMQDLNGEQVLEVGYLLAKDFWHKGYATEAAIACKKYAFDILGAKEVYSIIRDNNIASQNVAKRNKMTVAGKCVKNYYNKYMPHLAFSVQRETE